MVDAFKYFKSSNLRVEDIDADAPVDVTIEDFKITSYDDDECEHIDLYFKEYKKPLGLNNTNLRQVVGLHGRDTEDWIGQQITLIVREVEYKGKVGPAIRIDDKIPRATKSRARKPDDDDDRDPPPRTRKRRDDDDGDGPKRPRNNSSRRRNDDGPTEAKRARRSER